MDDGNGRFAIADFCDDIRQEVGNKITLIGIYTNELIVEKLPATLPKFVIYARAFTPLDSAFSRLAFRAYLNGEMIAEAVVPEASGNYGTRYPGFQRYVATMVMAFAPLVIGESGQLRVEVETEEGVLYAGSLWIREKTPEDHPQT